MAHFDDLSPYAYGWHSADPGVLHVGWLSSKHEYPKGDVPAHLVSTLMTLSSNLKELYRGYHVCELCQMPAELIGKPFSDQWEWASKRASNGEIRITEDGVTYAAPQLIVHYIVEHGYRPPQVFLQALEKVANQLEAERLDRLS